MWILRVVEDVPGERRRGAESGLREGKGNDVFLFLVFVCSFVPLVYEVDFY